jgi:Mg/Co/Ni transporter MgtE
MVVPIGTLSRVGPAKLKSHPALVASPALTTIVDIAGLLIPLYSKVDARYARA